MQMALYFKYNMGNECDSVNKSIQSKKLIEAIKGSRNCRRRYKNKFREGLWVLRKCRSMKYIGESITLNIWL